MSEQTTSTTEPAGGPDEPLYSEHPSMFRNNPLGFIGCVILVVIGWIILLVWWIQTLSTTLTITRERTILRRGLLSKHTNEVFHDNVRNVQVYQTLFQRMFDTGTVSISSAGQAGVEIQVKGLPHPERIRELINQYREQ